MTTAAQYDAVDAYAALVRPLRMLDVRLSDALAQLQNERVEIGESSCLPSLNGLTAELARMPGAPRRLSSRGFALEPLVTGAEGPLADLARLFDLDAFDLDLLLIAVAPEVDRRYERLYGALQDEPSSGRPTIDLALDLLCDDAVEKARRRGKLAGSALSRFGLVHLDDDAVAGTTSLASLLAPAPWVVAVLLGLIRAPLARAQWGRSGAEIVERLSDLCLAPEQRDVLQSVLERTRRNASMLDLRLTGEDVDALRIAGEVIAAEFGRCALIADLNEPAGTEATSRVTAIMVEAGLRGAVACFVVTSPASADSAVQALLASPLRQICHVVVLLKGDERITLKDDEAETFHLTAPDYPARLSAWRAAASGLGLGDDQLEALASRFRLSPKGMRAACRRAASAAPGDEAFARLVTAVKGDRGRELSRLTARVAGTQSWDDLVLPSSQMRQLQDLCAQVSLRHRVESDWGFSDKLNLGRGVCALFAGPSGTGKTMAAAIVARSLHLDLYRIDLSQTVSKYIGETEKTLDRIFDLAQAADAVLFFDEADTLFGKRTEVKDAHDRYANLEVGYLLQKMEEFDGLAILATNLRQHIDEAFIRRLRAIVEFPFPDEADRERIWRRVFPAKAPLADDVDLAAMARDVRLAGGSIRNIALGAAFLAAAQAEPIGQSHLRSAARDEYRKVGRAWSGAEA